MKPINACIYELPLDGDSLQGLDKIVYQMENYMKFKGATPIGPLIQCTQAYVNEVGEPEIKIQLIRQANKFILNVEPPYSMEVVLRCKDCLFVRFTGEQHQIKFAYDKLNLISFEKDIPLTGRLVTIFTSQSEDMFTADVFMEKATLDESP